MAEMVGFARGAVFATLWLFNGGPALHEGNPWWVDTIGEPRSHRDPQ